LPCVVLVKCVRALSLLSLVFNANEDADGDIDEEVPMAQGSRYTSYSTMVSMKVTFAFLPLLSCMV